MVLMALARLLRAPSPHPLHKHSRALDLVHLELKRRLASVLPHPVLDRLAHLLLVLVPVHLALLPQPPLVPRPPLQLLHLHSVQALVLLGRRLLSLVGLGQALVSA